jgi:GxxExxY protein
MNVGDPQTYAIIGAGLAVHRELGCGFLEAVYREALALEFRRREIPFVSEVLLPIDYKDTRLSLAYRVDFVCYDAVLVEVKALREIGPIEHAQAINYLRASGKHRAVILNFGARSLQHQRIVDDLNE